jgi:hypothetical protein
MYFRRRPRRRFVFRSALSVQSLACSRLQVRVVIRTNAINARDDGVRRDRAGGNASGLNGCVSVYAPHARWLVRSLEHVRAGGEDRRENAGERVGTPGEYEYACVLA